MMIGSNAVGSETSTALAPRRSLLFLIAGMLAVLIVGVVAAITIGRQAEATYSPRSPLGTVSTFLRLLQDKKVDEAYGLADIKADPGTGVRMSREQFHQSFDNWSQSSHRVTVVRATTTRNVASVIVEIHAFSGGSMGPSDATNQQTFTLARMRGTWRVTGPPYLYP